MHPASGISPHAHFHSRLGRACETQQNAFPGGDKPLALRVIGLNTIHSRAKAQRKKTKKRTTKTRKHEKKSISAADLRRHTRTKTKKRFWPRTASVQSM